MLFGEIDALEAAVSQANAAWWSVIVNGLVVAVAVLLPMALARRQERRRAWQLHQHVQSQVRVVDICAQALRDALLRRGSDLEAECLHLAGKFRDNVEILVAYERRDVPPILLSSLMHARRSAEVGVQLSEAGGDFGGMGAIVQDALVQQAVSFADQTKIMASIFPRFEIYT